MTKKSKSFEQKSCCCTCICFYWSLIWIPLSLLLVSTILFTSDVERTENIQQYNDVSSQWIELSNTFSNESFTVNGKNITQKNQGYGPYYPVHDPCNLDGDPDVGCVSSPVVYFSTLISNVEQLVIKDSSNYSLYDNEIKLTKEKTISDFILGCSNTTDCQSKCKLYNGTYENNQCKTITYLYDICIRVHSQGTHYIIDQPPSEGSILTTSNIGCYYKYNYEIGRYQDTFTPSFNITIRHGSDPYIVADTLTDSCSSFSIDTNEYCFGMSRDEQLSLAIVFLCIGLGLLIGQISLYFLCCRHNNSHIKKHYKKSISESLPLLDSNNHTPFYYSPNPNSRNYSSIPNATYVFPISPTPPKSLPISTYTTTPSTSLYTSTSQNQSTTINKNDNPPVKNILGRTVSMKKTTIIPSNTGPLSPTLIPISSTVIEGKPLPSGPHIPVKPSNSLPSPNDPIPVSPLSISPSISDTFRQSQSSTYSTSPLSPISVPIPVSIPIPVSNPSNTYSVSNKSITIDIDNNYTNTESKGQYDDEGEDDDDDDEDDIPICKPMYVSTPSNTNNQHTISSINTINHSKQSLNLSIPLHPSNVPTTNVTNTTNTTNTTNATNTTNTTNTTNASNTTNTTILHTSSIHISKQTNSSSPNSSNDPHGNSSYLSTTNTDIDNNDDDSDDDDSEDDDIPKPIYLSPQI